MLLFPDLDLHGHDLFNGFVVGVAGVGHSDLHLVRSALQAFLDRDLASLCIDLELAAGLVGFHLLIGDLADLLLDGVSLLGRDPLRLLQLLRLGLDLNGLALGGHFARGLLVAAAITFVCNLECGCGASVIELGSYGMLAGFELVQVFRLQLYYDASGLLGVVRSGNLLSVDLYTREVTVG